MPLDALTVSTQVRQMGELLVQRRAEEKRRLELARALVQEQRDEWERLAHEAELAQNRVAVPTGPLDETVPQPSRTLPYTAIATDGSEIDPDRHGASANFFVINIGWAKIPYGQVGRAAELRSSARLEFEDEQLFIADPQNPRRQVPVRDRHLDAERTVRELEKLVDLAVSEDDQHGDVPIVALVDGTLLFSVLEERPKDFLRRHFYTRYARLLDQLQERGIPIAAYASRTRGLDLVNLFREQCKGEPLLCANCGQAPPSGWTSSRKGRPVPMCALRGLTDADLLRPFLREWDRSALFRVRSNTHDPYFGDHAIHYFLLETGREAARVEVPAWVARDQVHLRLVHAALVDQCVKGQGYPAVLARADDRAVLTMQDRQVLNTLVLQELARRGVHARPSAKLSRKQVRTV